MLSRIVTPRSGAVVLLLTAMIGLLAVGVAPSEGQAAAAHVDSIPAAERTALIELYTSTNGAGWANRTNWRTADDTDFNAPGTECTWYGVTCGSEQLAVQELNLSYNSLAGMVPASLGSLAKLRLLELLSNQLLGTIPAELGNLVELRYLSLRFNQLSGSIPPELGNLTNLSTLFLDNNQLTGSIPPALGNLTNLSNLFLYSNQLTGSIPTELGNLLKLRSIDLGGNQLTGPIPTELGGLSRLFFLILGPNQLTGSIPAGFGSLTLLEYLGLFENQLSGSIPAELGNLTKLYWLGLFENQLSGSIPAELGNLTNLRYLFLESNQLTGTVPTTISSLANLFADGVDVSWNGLYSFDPAVVAFLYSKQVGGDWQSTQTVPVTGLTPGSATTTSVTLTWTPITYAGDTGGYQVFYSITSGGPWALSGTTADKSATGWTVTGLIPGTLYYFIVRSVTDPHETNQNTVVSDPSADVPQFTVAVWALTVSKSGTGTGTVTSNPAGIDCGTSCSTEFAHGTAVTLTPTADASSTFTGWSSACTGTGACAVTMDAAKAVTATFTLKTYALTVGKEGNGSGTVTSDPPGVDCGTSCSAEFAHGTAVTLTPTADASSTFTGWSGACTGIAACIVTTNAAKLVSANFSLKTHILMVGKADTGTGTVTSEPEGIDCGPICSASFDHDSAVTLTATADASSDFTGWSGPCTGTGACVVTMDAKQAVTAAFTLKTYALTVSKTGTGTGTIASNPAGINCGVMCSASFLSGRVVTLVQLAAPGSRFVGWSGACTGAGTCTVSMTAEVAVTAEFSGHRARRRLQRALPKGTPVPFRGW